MNKVFNIINNHSIPLFLGFKPRGPITLIQSAISQPRSSRNPGFNPCYLIQSVNTNLIQQDVSMVYRNDLIINRSIRNNWHFPNDFGYFMVIKETG